LQVGLHTITDLTEMVASSNVISGKGIVTMPFLMDVKINVEFDDIKVNAEGRVYEGVVKAVNDLDVAVEELETELSNIQSG